MLIGLIITAFALTSGKGQPRPSDLASTAAIGVGCSLLVGFLFEARSGLQNLVRADLMGPVRPPLPRRNRERPRMAEFYYVSAKLS